MEVSVLIPAHSPDPGRLARALAGLRAQTLPAGRWETVLVDNASSPALEIGNLPPVAPPNLRLVREPELGLSPARRRGFMEARAPICVLVDDDNVLAADYLEQVVRLFETHPSVGACGGRSLPEFERPPEDWQQEFLGLLALRDLGATPICSQVLRPAGATPNEYPACAPIGAGMAIRTGAARQWAARDARGISDRRGTELSSGGDNDIVLAVLGQGWQVAYFPELLLTHLIPAERLEAAYLARLNRGIQRSWMQVLALHAANPWPPLAPWTVPLRQLKSWVSLRAWRGPAARVRWQGACGHFEGRANRPTSHLHE